MSAESQSYSRSPQRVQELRLFYGWVVPCLFGVMLALAYTAFHWGYEGSLFPACLDGLWQGGVGGLIVFTFARLAGVRKLTEKVEIAPSGLRRTCVGGVREVPWHTMSRLVFLKARDGRIESILIKTDSGRRCRLTGFVDMAEIGRRLTDHVGSAMAVSRRSILAKDSPRGLAIRCLLVTVPLLATLYCLGAVLRDLL